MRDIEIERLIKAEEKRQKETLMLIPSENYTSKEVRQAVGSCLGHKYAEGYPLKRYYQGNRFIDEIESLAIERAKKLFRVKYVNVQPLSGSPANMAVYLALVKPGKTVMGMDLAAGGHLTHGSAVNFSGKWYKVVSYGVSKKSGFIDYGKVEELAKKYQPKLIWAGATAYPRIFDWQKFKKISQEVGAYLATDIAHYAGMIAGASYPSPAGFADVITTTTHKSLRGPRGAMIMTNNREIAKLIDRAVFPGLQGGPHENNIAGIAVCLKEVESAEFKKYAWQIIVNAKVLAGELLKYDFNLVTGGTDNHLILVDLGNKNVSGKEMALALEQAGIIVNKNMVPFDSRPASNPSGIRLGTPAVTSRGMKEREMRKIARWINGVWEILRRLKLKEQRAKRLKKIGKEVLELAKEFPLHF